MNKMRITTLKLFEKEPNRNSVPEKNNEVENFTRGLQEQTWTHRRKNQWS